MKKSMPANMHNTGNMYGASHSSYRPKSDAGSSENWFADHKKLLWGVGGAVVLGTGAFLLLKNKICWDKYSGTCEEMNALNQDVMNDLGEEIL